MSSRKSLICVELAQVLDFLFAAKLDPSDAFAAAKNLLEAGVKTREDIAALTPSRAKEIVADTKCHRKILAGLRKMPTLDGEASSPSKRQVTSPGSSSSSIDLPPPPADVMLGGERQLPDIVINRSPVMILWAAACAHSHGAHTWAEALSLGSACAAIFARAKGTSLGLYCSSGGSSSSFATAEVELLGKFVPATRTTADGSIRGLSQNRNDETLWDVAHPGAVHRSLSNAFGAALGPCWHAMLRLARAVPPASLNAESFNLYAQFRPNVPSGLAGWGQPGRLQLSKLDELWRPYGGGGSGGGGGDSGGVAGGSSVGASSGSSNGEFGGGGGGSVKAEAPPVKEEVGPPTPAASAEAMQSLLFSEITKCQATGGATPEHLTSVVRTPSGGDASRKAMCDCLEALQAEGAVYEREGRYLPL